MWISLLVLGFLLIVDQLTKYLVEISLKTNQVVNVIPNFLSITKVYNTGAAWSSFNDSTWFLCIISLVATIVLIYFFLKIDWKKKKCYSVAISLMLAGTFGNLIDRFLYVVFPSGRAGVIDMIVLEPLDWLWNSIFKSGFPIWNIADACLVIGIVFLAVDMLFFQEKRAVKK